MSRLFTLLIGLLGLFTVDAQLRPRRVGTNAMGEQEVEYTDVPSNAGVQDELAQLRAENARLRAAQGGGGDPMAEMMKALGDGDLSTLMKGMDMENNPLLKQMAAGNPELAEMMSNPEKMQEQLAQVGKMMASPEGQDMMKNMMSQMTEVMSDPEKLKAGLEQFATNPALAGLADAIPGLQEALSDPEQLAEQAAKAAEVFQAMNDPEKRDELLASMPGGAEAMEQMQAMLGGDGSDPEAMQQNIAGAMAKIAELMGGEGGEGGGLEGLAGGGGGDDLKARVRAQMAEMMNKKRAAAGGGMDDEDLSF